VTIAITKETITAKTMVRGALIEDYPFTLLDVGTGRAHAEVGPRMHIA
jgi:hypothetical protein